MIDSSSPRSCADDAWKGSHERLEWSCRKAPRSGLARRARTRPTLCQIRDTERAMRKRFLWLLKHTLNRLTLRVAHSRHGPFSVIRHMGRKSGKTYEVPVILATVPEGFVAELNLRGERRLVSQHRRGRRVR